MKNFGALYQEKPAHAMDMGPFQEEFGDDTPNIVPSPIGRYRLVQALRSKYGDNYRSSTKALDLLNHFDSQYDLIKKRNKLSGGQT